MRLKTLTLTLLCVLLLVSTGCAVARTETLDSVPAASWTEDFSEETRRDWADRATPWTDDPGPSPEWTSGPDFEPMPPEDDPNWSTPAWTDGDIPLSWSPGPPGFSWTDDSTIDPWTPFEPFPVWSGDFPELIWDEPAVAPRLLEEE